MKQTELYKRYIEIKENTPRPYARDLATQLGVSEAELIDSRVGYDVHRLKSDILALLNALENVGEVKALTRNDFAVHEHMGCYSRQSLNGHTGLILNPGGIDLRLFLHHWQCAFAVHESGKHSLQFFDGQGDAVHKVYALPGTDMVAWQKIIEQFTDNSGQPFSPSTARVAHYADKVDAEKVEQEWRAMTDVHDFFLLLHRHNISRQQAFNAVSDDLAYRVDNSAVQGILNQAQAERNDIMIFVANRGCVQIFTGIIEKLEPLRGWLNIFNERFTLHLKDDAIIESWVTCKPTKDGFVTSLELYSADGNQIAQLFGQRSEGLPEQAIWRKQISSLHNLAETQS
ncbi:hemin-degrading factor (plasmid) [Klebsiella sp. WOUb02]|uniref:hemin-degrading factor n=1 Tax=Klebsiella sp. WOUb02 TaxID=3161071 RepID=UPI003CE69C28